MPSPLLSRRRVLSLLLVQFSLSFQLAAQDVPQLEKLDEKHFRLGEIVADLEEREIRFPATVNMNRGAVEFVLVHETGRVHESILATKISPTALRTVFSLMKCEPKKALFEVEGGKNPVPLEIELGWIPEGGTIMKRISLRSTILLKTVERPSEGEEITSLDPLPNGPWAYTGSSITKDGFVAEKEGDLIAIERRFTALINLPHSKTLRDDIWEANQGVLPPNGTDISVFIQLPEAAEKP